MHEPPPHTRFGHGGAASPTTKAGPASSPKDWVRVFDTTLRDGEQSPGCSMTAAEKLRIARMLAGMGVDIIEAGFPIASDGDFESVRGIARTVRGPIICGLARCARADIERAWEAVRDAERPRIHVFLATSAIHREHKLRMAKEEIVRRTREGVAMARELCPDVEFSPEDASRTEPDFLVEVVEAAIDAGATTMNIPDTVGYAVPEHYGEVFAHLRRCVRGIDRAILSAHCHDDLGLAVANTLAAIRAGARQVECTINGIGERAGNAALEEIVMAIRTRSDAFGVTVAVDSRSLHPASRLLSSITGSRVQPNKAVVGDNAFAHEAGIHQHGMMQHHSTYEIMRPEDVGHERTQLVLGKHSGRHAFRQRVEHLGFKIDDPEIDRAFELFKLLADRKKTVYDADIEAIVLGGSGLEPSGWRLAAMQVTAGRGMMATASVTIAHSDARRAVEAAVGDGPVDASFKAVQRAIGMELSLRSYQVRSITEGEDALGEVIIEVEHLGNRYRGRAVSTDVVEAGVLAHIELVNRIDRLHARTEQSAAAVVGGAA